MFQPENQTLLPIVKSSNSDQRNYPLVYVVLLNESLEVKEGGEGKRKEEGQEKGFSVLFLTNGDNSVILYGPLCGSRGATKHIKSRSPFSKSLQPVSRDRDLATPQSYFISDRCIS